MSSSDLPAFVTGELRKGESIIWHGRPDPPLAFQCGVPIGVAAIFIMSRLHYEWLARFHGILDLFNMAFNVVPVLSLAVFALSPIFFYYYARQTYYLYTSERILILHGGIKRQFQSFALENLTPLFQMKVFGKTILAWDAPGTFTSNDGSFRSNRVCLFAVENDTPQKIGVDFPETALFPGSGNS